jgi:hypothetical protein
MKLLRVEKLNNNKKKYKAVFKLDSGKEKSTSFGASGYRDYTLMSNKSSKFYEPDKKKRDEVKRRYIERHSKNENHNNPLSAGALSRHLLWSKPTLTGSLRDFKKRFNL